MFSEMSSQIVYNRAFFLKNELKGMDCTVNDVCADVHSKTISVGLEDEELLNGNGVSANLRKILKMINDFLIKKYSDYDISIYECETLWAGKMSEGMIYNAN